MNKKNKGFTLIEILATIAIIAVVTLIATVTYKKVRQNIINRQYKNLKALIEIAGVRYTSKTGKDAYFVEELIEEGYLDPDDETGNIYDPRDNHSLNCHLVKVNIENTNYDAELGDVNFKTKDGCKLSEIMDDPNLAPISLIAMLHGTNINYVTTTSTSEKGVKLTKDDVNIYKNVKIVDIDGSRWTNQQLDLTASINTNLAYYVDVTGAKYIWNGDSANITTSNTHTTSVEAIYNGLYGVEVVMKDNKRYNANITYKYDAKAPVIKLGSIGYVNNDKDVWKKSKWIYFEVVEEGVGLDRIYIGKRPCEDLLKDASLGTVPTGIHQHVQMYEVKEEVGIEGENGEVNVCAVDKLGNIDKKKVSFETPKIDITPPHCTKDLATNRSNDVIGEHNKYQWYERTIKQYCYDNNMINGKLVVGSGCDENASGGGKDGDYVYFKKTFNPSVGTAIKTGYITITDNVGWTTKCPVDVYIDRKAPLCSKSTGNTQTHINNNNATTLGVGSTNNWDKNYRHITQYCYDEHVGCRNQTESDNWSYNDGSVIRTSKIRIWDKVPACSKKASFSEDYCYTHYNDANNATVKNNSTNCTVGVYIDHLPPVAVRESGARVHSGNRIRFSCSDPSYNGIQGSGVISFKATATTAGASTILPCQSAGNCSTSYGPELTNTNGNLLQFKIIHTQSSIAIPADNLNVSTYCEDKAHNIEEHNTANGNLFETQADLANSINDNEYVKQNYQGKNIGPCSTGCKLRTFRPAQGASCQSYSYECQCEDTACNANNDGEGVTCCLSGADPKWGCKKHANNITTFGSRLDYTAYPGTQGNVSYMNYNNKHYIKPDINSDDYEEYCDAGGCEGGYECLVYNCYPDNPYGSSIQSNTVCGNYTE